MPCTPSASMIGFGGAGLILLVQGDPEAYPPEWMSTEPRHPRQTEIHRKLRRMSVLRIWWGIDATTKETVLAGMEEESRSVRDSRPDLANALLVAAAVLDVLATEEAATRETTDADAEWLLAELESLQGRRR